MNNYLALLLFIIPGFLARKIYEHLNDHLLEKNTFLETIYSLIYNVFVLILVYAIFYGFGRTDIMVNTIFGDIKSSLGSLVIYAIVSLLSSIVIACLWHIVHPYYMQCINYLRGKSSKNKMVFSKSIFDESFNDGGVHWVEIFKENKLVFRGIIKSMNYIGSELYIEDATEEMGIFLNEAGRVEKYKGYYIDLNKNFVIKEIDTSILEEFLPSK